MLVRGVWGRLDFGIGWESLDCYSVQKPSFIFLHYFSVAFSYTLTDLSISVKKC